MPVEQVERLITRPIEEKLRTMGEVDNIKDSTSKVGQCLIHVSIKDEVPAEELPMVWKLLRNRMSDVKPDLPEGTTGPWVEDSFGDTAVATIALWSDGFSMAEMLEAARQPGWNRTIHPLPAQRQTTRNGGRSLGIRSSNN